MPASDIVDIIRTPLFWVISAVGSIIIGVIGNLVTPKVAGWISNRTHKKRSNVTYRKAQFLGEVAIRVSDSSKIIGTKLDSIHAFLLSCLCMLFALILLTAATAIDWLLFPQYIRLGVAILSIPVMWLSFSLASHGLRSRKIAMSAEKRISQEMKLGDPENPDTRPVFKQMEDWDRKQFGITLNETRDLMSKRIESRKKRWPRRTEPRA